MIKVIVELQAKPGTRAELMSVIERIVAEHGSTQRGFLGSTRYEVLDNPDMLIEIAEWESAEARAAHMEEAAATGAYEPLLEILAAKEVGTVAACSKLRLAGLGAILSSRAVAYSAKEPAAMPNTSSPGWKRVTSVPISSTRPAASMPRTRALGRRNPKPRMRSRYGRPVMTC